MSSAGQIVGGVLGAVVGFFTMGGPVGAIQGAALGSSLGGWIDPPPGPNLRGPTLDDKTFQSTAYGVSIPSLYGTIATSGNVFYLENNEYKAVESTERTGGKGGSSGTYTTTTYYATFAVALSEAVPGSIVRRIWAGGKLIYSTINNDLGTLLQSAKNGVRFTFYDGTQELPDSRMEAVVGVGSTPSYEGTAYIIFYDFDLTDYGNGLAGCPIKVELSAAPIKLELSGIRRTAFTDILDATASRHSLLPLTMQGSIAQCLRVVGGNVELSQRLITFNGGSNLATITGSEEDSQVGFITGYSSRSSYCLTERWIIDDEYEEKSASLEGRKIIFPFRSDFDSYRTGGDFHAVYDHPGGTWFILRASVDQTNPPPLSSILWNASDSLFSNYLLEIDIGGFGALAFDTYLDRMISIIGDGNVRVYSTDDWQKSQDFMVSEASGAVCAVYENGFVYAVCSDRDRINSGFIDVAVIDIDAKTANRFSISVPVYSGASALGPFVSKAGPVLCIGNTSDGGFVNFYYINLMGVMQGITGVSLQGVVAAELSASGISPEFYDLSELSDDYLDGYRVTGPGSARGALGPLQVAHLFDFVEHGYTLKAVKRGADPAIEIPLMHMDARSSGQAAGVVIQREFETESQLPSRYSLTFLDFNREYDSNTEYADYPSRSFNERNEQLAIVMTSDKAAKLADVIINLAWVERASFVFTLPQAYLGLKPALVVRLEVVSGVWVVARINSVTYTADQRLEVNAKLAEPALYQSGAVGAVIEPPSGVIPFVGNSTAIVLDIPLIDDLYDQPGYRVAMYGEGSWPGAVFFKSVDQGQTYAAVQNFTQECVCAQVMNLLTANDGFIIDRINNLRINTIKGEFTGVTEAQMMTGKNYCAYGMPGRWEIICYAGSELQVDGTRVLSTLIRGMRGTEWATGLHQAGDILVLLDAAGISFIGENLSTVGFTGMRYRAVTVGQNFAESSEHSFDYLGTNLKPLSPVQPRKQRVGDDWDFSWVTRTRFSSNFWLTGAQPLNEPVMRWQIALFSGGIAGRVVEVFSEQYSYTAEQQVEDFGAVQLSVTAIIRQFSSRVGFGFPLTI